MSAKEYCELVKETTGFLGAYPLSVPINVGDYFTMNDDGVLVQLGSVFDDPLWEKGVPVETEKIEGSTNYYVRCTRKDSGKAGTGVEVAGVGVKASVGLSFNSASGFALAFEAAERSRIEDLPSVQRAVLQKAKDGTWHRDWLLATDVITADSVTLVVAAESGSKVSLNATVDLPATVGPVSISDPKLGWTSTDWTGSGYATVCKSGTPLFHCIKVSKSWWGRLEAENLGADTLDEAFSADDPFDEQ